MGVNDEKEKPFRPPLRDSSTVSAETGGSHAYLLKRTIIGPICLPAIRLERINPLLPALASRIRARRPAIRPSNPCAPFS